MEALMDVLKFKYIMNLNRISLEDIRLTTGLPTSIINRIIENGEGAIDDINKVMGCLGVKVNDCINEEVLMQLEKPTSNINIVNMFKQQQLIRFIYPEEVSLIKSFKGETEPRYMVRLDLNSAESLQLLEDRNTPLQLVEDIKQSKIISTHIHRNSEDAIREAKDIFEKHKIVLEALYPNYESLPVTDILYGEDELILEYYEIIFDPFDNNRLMKINKVYPKSTITKYNDEKLKKVYAICSKVSLSTSGLSGAGIRSKIYSDYDLESGKIEDDMKLLSYMNITTSVQGCEIIEFLVPRDFDNKSYLIETRNAYNEVGRLTFNFIELYN